MMASVALRAPTPPLQALAHPLLDPLEQTYSPHPTELQSQLAYDYQLIVGGKPLFSPMFAFPVSYELTILFTAFATIGGMFFLNGLPMHYHPVLKYEHIRRGMDDQFFIVIEARDPRFNLANTKALLEKAGGKNISELEA